jgi:hypothetical protein
LHQRPTPAPSEGLSVTSNGHHKAPRAPRELGFYSTGDLLCVALPPFCAAVEIAVSALAAPAMAAHHAPEAGYYVIRWNDTGICPIWNTGLRYRPAQVFSKYKVVSKLVPTFADATNIQLMRAARSCTL